MAVGNAAGTALTTTGDARWSNRLPCRCHPTDSVGCNWAASASSSSLPPEECTPDDPLISGVRCRPSVSKLQTHGAEEKGSPRRAGKGEHVHSAAAADRPHQVLHAGGEGGAGRGGRVAGRVQQVRRGRGRRAGVPAGARAALLVPRRQLHAGGGRAARLRRRCLAGGEEPGAGTCGRPDWVCFG